MSKATDKANETSAHQVIEEHVTANQTEGKKKKKYSSDLSRNMQLLEKAHIEAGKRIAEAASAGLGVWLAERNASAAKRKDGAIKDFTKNASKGLRKAMREGAEAPADFLDEVAKMKILPRR